jgi:hypothetical protein
MILQTNRGWRQRHWAPVLMAALVVIGASVLVGCGGGDSSSSSLTSSSEPTAEAGSENEVALEEAAPTAEGPLGPLSEKLAEHGFRGTAVQPGDGDVEWHIAAEPKSGPPTIEVSYYRDASAAQKEGKEIEGIYANHAGLIRVNGRLMIRVGAEDKLSEATREAFAEVEADAGEIE